MKTKITATLAFLLLAGASTAALAQDHDRVDGGGGGGGHGAHGRGLAAPPVAARTPPGAPAAPPAVAVAPRGGPHGPMVAPQPALPAPQAPQGGHGRFGAPPQGGQPRFDRGPEQRFDRGAGPQRFDRAPGPGPGAGRQFDRAPAPREVIPPVGERGWDGRRDGRADGRWDGRGDNRWAGGRGDGRGGQWSRGERWQPGHFPPVFWSQHRFRAGGYRAPYGYYVHAWAFGDILPRDWYGQDYWIGDFLDYDLPYPPPGYEWVRVGGDALLVDRFTGRIVQVVRGIFW